MRATDYTTKKKMASSDLIKLLYVPLFNLLIWSRKKESNLRLRHLNAYVKLQFKILPNLNYYVVLSITPFLEISSPEVGLEPTTQGLKFQIIKVAVRRFYKLRCLMSLALPTELLWHI